jgi:CRISPR-associated protein Csx1
VEREKSLIVQIGRMDRNQEIPYSFAYKGQTIEKPLSSLAFKEFLPDAEVILLYPVSLPFNRVFLSLDEEKSKDPFWKMVRNILTSDEEKTKYLFSPETLFEKHPHRALCEGVMCFPALGEYEGVSFEASLEDVILYFFVFFVREYLRKPFNSLYVDVSSGLNIYVSALLEAAKYFHVWLQFFEEENRKIFLVYTDPVLGSGKKTYHLFLYPLESRAFFSSPLSYNNVKNGLPKKVVETELGQGREQKNKLKRYLENFCLLFGSFLYATPLVIYSFSFDKREEVEDFSQWFVEEIIKKISQNLVKPFHFDYHEIKATLFALGMYRGLLKLLEEKNISQKEVTLVELRSSTEAMYEKFELFSQLSLVGSEVSSNFRSVSETKDWVPLRNFLRYDIGEFEDRHFFAHAGFERNSVLVRKEGDNIWLKYAEEAKERIRNCVRERV